MADEWVGIVKQATERALKGQIDLTLRRRLWLAMMERRGNVITRYTGSHSAKGAVQKKEPPVESYADAGQVNYSRRDLLANFTMDWRGYLATDALSQKEKDEMGGGGNHQMVNRYRKIFPNLLKAVRNKIGLEIYIDGGAANNENRFCGLETHMGDDGNTVVADVIAAPDDTWFGLDTDVNQSGTWSSDLTTPPNATIATDWPEGEGSADYDFNAPKLVNYGSTSWPSGKNTWSDNCINVIRRTAQWLRLTTGIDDATLLCMLTGQLHTQWKDALDDRVRIVTPHRESEDLGFSDVLNFEGVAIKAEYGVPAATGYMLDINEAELRIISGELLNRKGPDWDPKSFAWVFAVFTFGNLFFLPKHTAKLYPYATS